MEKTNKDHSNVCQSINLITIHTFIGATVNYNFSNNNKQL